MNSLRCVSPECASEIAVFSVRLAMNIMTRYITIKWKPQCLVLYNQGFWISIRNAVVNLKRNSYNDELSSF